MKRTRKITRLVTILCAAIFIFGCTTTVFAANDLVGRATGNSSSSSTTTNRSSGTSTGRTTTYNGTGSTTAVTKGTETTSYMPANVATTTYTKGAAVTAPASTTAPRTTRVSSQVQTGVMEKILPFAIVIGAAMMVFWLFFHLQMNQVRYGKSEKYYKELLDFKVMCRN